jgi:endonuclease III-like uncharacterized protein
MWWGNNLLLSKTAFFKHNKPYRMITVHPQYVVDAAQTCTAVLLPATEWEQILDALEELDDIQAYDTAQAGSQEAIPLAQALREIGVENS